MLGCVCFSFAILQKGVEKKIITLGSVISENDRAVKNVFQFILDVKIRIMVDINFSNELAASILL